MKQHHIITIQFFLKLNLIVDYNGEYYFSPLARQLVKLMINKNLFFIIKNR